jgi:hypothetical protein
MVDPRQQTTTGGVTDPEVLPNEHRTKSKTLAIAVLAVICVAGFLFNERPGAVYQSVERWWGESDQHTLADMGSWKPTRVIDWPSPYPVGECFSRTVGEAASFSRNDAQLTLFSGQRG